MIILTRRVYANGENPLNYTIFFFNELYPLFMVGIVAFFFIKYVDCLLLGVSLIAFHARIYMRISFIGFLYILNQHVAYTQNTYTDRILQ